MNKSLCPETLTQPRLDPATSGLKGRRVLVTGGARGMGLAIARSFARQEAKIALHHYQPVEEANAAADEIKAAGASDVVTIKANFFDRNAVTQLVDDVVAQLGGVDVLVNNAGGITAYTDFQDLPMGDWDQAMAINMTAPFMLMRACWPHMQKQHWGRIINISSCSVGHAGSGSSLHYVATKSGLEAMTRTLSKEGARDGILVNAVRPGVIDTGMINHIAGYDDERLSARIASIPVGRAGQAFEIAGVVAFLASASADFMTGQIITVAGGD